MVSLGMDRDFKIHDHERSCQAESGMKALYTTMMKQIPNKSFAS
jgi:hypothetical protein